MTDAQPFTLPDALLTQLSAFLEVRMGLHFPRERWRDLERGIAAASRDAGHADAETFIHWLLGAPLTRTRIEGLASYLTIGETYFFREKNSLDILEQRILPGLLQDRAQGPGDRRLRIWSAGCCSGEEPYSIAMLLERLIPDPEQWQVSILATDINPQFLRKAATGIYSEWSFRETPDWLRRRYFTRLADGRFEIQPQIRRMVSFSYLNLAEDAYPSLVNGTNAMDIILCRNVLIYFAQDRAKQVVSKLHRSLVDGGWVITSPAETSATLFSEFATVEFPGVFFYRRMANAGHRAAATLEQSAPWQERDASLAHAPAHAAAHAIPPAELPNGTRTDFATQGVQAAVHPAPASASAVNAALHDADEEDDADDADAEREMLRRQARACADQGRLSEAVEWCAKAIAADKMNPAHYYLLATIEQERGQGEAAESALGRALYLEPDFILAHFALGNLCLAAGRRSQARRHFSNALNLLQACPADALLPEADGLSSVRLIEIIRAVQASLPRRAKELAT